MDINLNPKQLLASGSRFLHRYHVVMFTLLAVGGLAFATFRLYSVVTAAPTTTTTQTVGNFDQATIDKINNLRASDEEMQPLKLPSGRTNPFK